MELSGSSKEASGAAAKWGEEPEREESWWVRDGRVGQVRQGLHHCEDFDLNFGCDVKPWYGFEPRSDML